MGIICRSAEKDVRAIVKDLVKTLNPTGPREIEDVVIVTGDSLTAASSLDTRIPSLQGRVTVINDGNGGDTISDLEARSATTDSYLPYQGTARQFVLIGTNDLTDASGKTGATTHTELSAYCKDRQNAGWKVSVATLPRQDGAVNASEVLAYNKLIQENWQEYADELIDLDGDPRFQTSTDTVYFNADEVHLTTLGYNILGYAYDVPYASTEETAFRMLQHFGGDIEVTSIEGKANNNTRIEFASNYMDHYYNNAFIMRVGNGEVAINPGGATYDLRVFADNGGVPFHVDTSANGSAGHVLLGALPTSDPAVAGALWSDSGTVKVSAG